MEKNTRAGFEVFTESPPSDGIINYFVLISSLRTIHIDRVVVTDNNVPRLSVDERRKQFPVNIALASG